MYLVAGPEDRDGRSDLCVRGVFLIPKAAYREPRVHRASLGCVSGVSRVASQEGRLKSRRDAGGSRVAVLGSLVAEGSDELGWSQSRSVEVLGTW